MLIFNILDLFHNFGLQIYNDFVRQLMDKLRSGESIMM